MISCFGHPFQPLGPRFSFLGTSLLAATPTFGEVHVTATKRTCFSKTRIINFEATSVQFLGNSFQNTVQLQKSAFIQEICTHKFLNICSSFTSLAYQNTLILKYESSQTSQKPPKPKLFKPTKIPIDLENHLTLLAPGFFGWCSTEGVFPPPSPSIIPLSLKLDFSNFV